tara:strand:+ start:201 stop:464 length:264 start_codon:yes stop_codon:yes gene_type:complete
MKMATLNKNINNAKTLEEVLNLLNGWEMDKNDDQDRLDHHVDICDLPKFGNEPIEVSECFSWNDTHLLISNTCTGDAFELVERTEDQ